MDALAEEIVEGIAGKLVSGGVLTFAIADRIKNNEGLLAALIDQLNPEIVAKALAKELVYRAVVKKGTNLHAMTLYGKIMNLAQKEVAHMIAQDIIKETRSA